MDDHNEKPSGDEKSHTDEKSHSDQKPYSDEEFHGDEESHGDDPSGELVSNCVPDRSFFNIIRVKTGEDIAMKIMSHAQQGSQSICVVSANGAISSAKLRRPYSSGGTFTFEFQGRFEILSLNGSFTPIENGDTSNTCEWLSVSLTGPDGRVIGGRVDGQLIAGSPVQIIVGSFFPGDMQECSKDTENGILSERSREAKKQKTDSTTFVAPPAVIHLPSAEMVDPSYGQRTSDTMNQTLSSSSGDNVTAYPSATDSNDTPSE